MGEVRTIQVVFDRQPGHEPPRFVEVEDDDGNSIKIGEWVQREDGFWALRLKAELPGPAPLKEGWEMPAAPMCATCGEPVAAVAYFDGEEISFNWDEYCEHGEHETGAHGDDFDEWPFTVERVTRDDLTRAGFRCE